MSFFDYLKYKINKSKTRRQNKGEFQEQYYSNILDQITSTFFPETGAWSSSCLKRSKSLSKKYLPCHLRDVSWLSDLMLVYVENNGVKIPKSYVKKYIKSSPYFEEKRSKFEDEIVKHQIKVMKIGGIAWPIKEDESDVYVSGAGEDIDIEFRESILDTLSAIGMDYEIIEAGIERNADLWRDEYMAKAFDNKFNPKLSFVSEPIKAASDEHRENWLRLRRYDYYQRHKSSVDKYGVKFEDMPRCSEEADHLRGKVEHQNFRRENEIDKWKELQKVKMGTPLDDTIFKV